MNYTKNYHLPQWVKSDRIRMEDFNSAMASIDSGLAGADSKADAAQTAANAAAETAAGARDQAAAAAEAAASALDKAGAAGSAVENAYTPDNKPFVVGSYVGEEENQMINIGFRPSFMIVTGMRTGFDPNSHDTFDKYFAMSGGRTLDENSLQYRLLFVNEGFIVFRVGHEDACLPVLNEPGRRYDFIAFR